MSGGPVSLRRERRSRSAHGECEAPLPRTRGRIVRFRGRSASPHCASAWVPAQCARSLPSDKNRLDSSLRPSGPRPPHDRGHHRRDRSRRGRASWHSSQYCTSSRHAEAGHREPGLRQRSRLDPSGGWRGRGPSRAVGVAARWRRVVAPARGLARRAERRWGITWRRAGIRWRSRCPCG
jgi:hypothetical protein